LSRNTIRSALRSADPPRYSRASGGSKLDPFWAEIQRLLREDPDLPGVRVGELLEPLGWDGGKTILDDCVREMRPLFREVRTTQRTIYRPAEICQFDVWEPKGEVPVGHGQIRKDGRERSVPLRGGEAFDQRGGEEKGQRRDEMSARLTRVER
jgi:hypothetical protein